MSATRSGVRPAVPEMVPEVASGTKNGTATLALLVAVAGAWMWAPVAGAESPEKLIWYVRLLPSRLSEPIAVAGVSTDGISEAPLSNTVKGNTVFVVGPVTRNSEAGVSFAIGMARFCVVSTSIQFDSERSAFFWSRNGPLPPAQVTLSIKPLSEADVNMHVTGARLPNRPSASPLS